MNHITYDTVIIDIKEFDERPGLFCTSYKPDINAVISSINKIGLLNKPYARRNREGSIDIVTGYKRILAAKALGWKNIPCLDLTYSGLPDADLLIINLYDNLCTRRFNHLEKGMILDRLLMFFTMEEIYKSYMHMIGISSRREADILAKIKVFDDNEKDFIAEGSLSIKTIELILEMKEPSRTTALEWISKLKLNFNQQALFIEYINDISTREGKGIPELLDEDIYVRILSDTRQNLPQKSKRIVDLLRARRLPMLTNNEKAFAGQISALSLPKCVRIKHPPFFEGNDYLLEISFRDGKMLKETIEALFQIKKLASIRDPWKEE